MVTWGGGSALTLPNTSERTHERLGPRPGKVGREQGGQAATIFGGFVMTQSANTTLSKLKLRGARSVLAIVVNTV